MIKIGLTGGIGSGKTYVSKFFTHLGVPIYNSDLGAKLLMTKDIAVRQKLISTFGSEVYWDTGEINKFFLRKLVFEDNSARRTINSIVHPAVGRDFARWAKEQKAPYVIQESALIYESGVEDRYNCVILVTASDQVRIDRLEHRDNSTREEIRTKMNAQLTQDLKASRTDHIISNNPEDNLADQIYSIHRQLLELNGTSICDVTV